MNDYFDDQLIRQLLELPVCLQMDYSFSHQNK